MSNRPKPSTNFDPRNPLIVPDLSGRLKDHFQACDACGGQGSYDDDEGEDPCDECDGEGRLRWPCWYGADRGLCLYCNEDEVLLACCYETGHGNDDHNYVCLPCFLKHHKEACGCGLWEWAEAMIVGGLR